MTEKNSPENENCFRCFTCQIQCGTGYNGGDMPQQNQPQVNQCGQVKQVQNFRPQMRTQILTEDRVKEIILEELISLGLVKTPEKRKELSNASCGS